MVYLFRRMTTLHAPIPISLQSRLSRSPPSSAAWPSSIVSQTPLYGAVFAILFVKVRDDAVNESGKREQYYGNNTCGCACAERFFTQG